MSQFIWLALMAMCGWFAGRVVGGRGVGGVADLLLGITGASAVRFFFDVLEPSLHHTEVLWFSVCGSAAFPMLVRILMKRHDTSVSVHASQNLPSVKTTAQVIPFRRHFQKKKRYSQKDADRSSDT